MRFVLDINHIRQELNELPFRDGKREVLAGRITEMFEGESEQATADHLRRCERELRRNTLILTRHEDNSDALFVVQELRTSPLDLSWMAEPTNWVARFTTVVLEMVLPGLAGLWLDNQLETQVLTLLGLGLGVSLGMWHLIALTQNKRNGIK